MDISLSPPIASLPLVIIKLNEDPPIQQISILSFTLTVSFHDICQRSKGLSLLYISMHKEQSISLPANVSRTSLHERESDG